MRNDGPVVQRCYDHRSLRMISLVHPARHPSWHPSCERARPILITTLCQVMQVSPSGFFASPVRPESAHAQADRRLRVLVCASFDESRRIHEDLTRAGRAGEPRRAGHAGRRAAGAGPQALALDSGHPKPGGPGSPQAHFVNLPSRRTSNRARSAIAQNGRRMRRATTSPKLWSDIRLGSLTSTCALTATTPGTIGCCRRWRRGLSSSHANGG